MFKSFKEIWKDYWQAVADVHETMFDAIARITPTTTDNEHEEADCMEDSSEDS